MQVRVLPRFTSKRLGTVRIPLGSPDFRRRFHALLCVAANLAARSPEISVEDQALAQPDLTLALAVGIGNSVRRLLQLPESR